MVDKKEKKGGLYFKKAETVTGKRKRNAERTKYQEKGYYVRTEPEKSLRTGKIFYGIYIRKKK